MNAKNLIQGLNETESADFFSGQPPGSTSGQQRPMPPRPPRRPGEQITRRMFDIGTQADPETFDALPGAERPRGFFSPKETSQLKDIIILTLAQLMRSDLDSKIGQTLASGGELDPGQLQHILDEASRLKLPETHKPILQKIYQKLSEKPQAPR